MTTKISESNIQTTTLSALGGGGPKISSIVVTDSSYNNLDDTAVALEGGYIKLIGEDFATGCQVLIGLTPVTSVTFVSDTEVRAQVPATSAGTYIVYLVNTDGGTAIRVNAITFSSTPTWVTASSLSGLSDTAISIQLSASTATTYSLQAGSSLPDGVSLSSSGLISGTVTGISSDTVYNFTILATDTELQDSPRAFALSISTGDPLWMYNALLLSGNGTNDAQNNTFLDSSTNNFTITRAGNTTQGTFSPYGSRWSNYFDGTGDYLIASSGSGSLGTGDFTVEGWIYCISNPVTYSTIFSNYSSSGSTAFAIFSSFANNKITMYVGGSTAVLASTTITYNTWTHIAAVRNSGVITLYINGVSQGTLSYSGSSSGDGIARIGCAGDGPTSTNFNGYISNSRWVIGTAVYTANFTPPTSPLTTISGTSLLTCQSNRFIDNSSNAFALTYSGTPSVQRFSPFRLTDVYSTSTIGGSGYFDGTGDYLSLASNTAFNMGTDNFTLECYYYHVSGSSATYPSIFSSTDWVTGGVGLRFNNLSSSKFEFFWNGVGDPWLSASATSNPFQWNHVALTRSGNNFTLWVNGQSAATGTSSGAINFNYNTGGPRIGWGPWDGNNGYLKGIISNLRLVKGTAVYTTSFTPPTAPVTATTGTSLLCNFTNASIIDNAMMNNLETIGDAKISTTQSKFGGSSMYFDGTGDYLKIPSSPLWDFGTGDFTIEFWIKTTQTTSNAALIGREWVGSPWTGGWGIQLNGNTSSAMTIYWADYSSSAAFMVANTTSYRDGNWHHIAWVRNGTSFVLYIDGVSVATATSSLAFGTVNKNIGIGEDLTFGPRTYLGYMDDLRVTKGYARYTANFTAPTTAHTLK